MATPEEMWEEMGDIPSLFAASPNIGNLPPEIASNLIASSLQALYPQGSGTAFQDFVPRSGLEYFLKGPQAAPTAPHWNPVDTLKSVAGAIGLGNPSESIFGIPWSNDPALGAKGTIQQGRPTGSDILAERLAGPPVVPVQDFEMMGPAFSEDDVLRTVYDSAMHEIDPAFGPDGIRNTGVQAPTSMFDRFTPAPFEQGINIGGAGFTEPPIDARTAAFLSGIDPAFGPEGERTTFVNRPLVEADRRAALAAAANLSPESLVPSNILGYEPPPDRIPTRAEQNAAAMAAGVDITSPWFSRDQQYDAMPNYPWREDLAAAYYENNPNAPVPVIGGTGEHYWDDAIMSGLENLVTAGAGYKDVADTFKGTVQGAVEPFIDTWQYATKTRDEDIEKDLQTAISTYNNITDPEAKTRAKKALDATLAAYNSRFPSQPYEVDPGDTSGPSGPVANVVPAKEPVKAVAEANKFILDVDPTDPFSSWNKDPAPAAPAAKAPAAKAPAAKAPAAAADSANVPWTDAQWRAAGYVKQPDGIWDLPASPA